MKPTMTTLVHQLKFWAEKVPDDPAIHGKAGGSWQSYTWAEYWEAAREVAKGLIALGHQPGDCVAIVGSNRVEWVIGQMGIMAAGGVPAPGYATNTIDQVAHILRNSECRIAMADTKALVDNYREAAASDADNIRVEHFVTMLDDEDDEATSLSALRASGREQSDDALDERIAALTGDDLCFLIYTSGTTGISKGVMLEHGAAVAMADSVIEHVDWRHDRRQTPYVVVSYLPLCHIAEQMMTNLGMLRLGGEAYFCPDLKQVKDYLVEVRPTIFAAVPRVWEKFQAAMEARFEGTGGLKGKMLGWARRTELAAFEEEQRSGRPVEGFLRGVARDRVLANVTKALGLDRLVVASTAAAPISVGTLRFFASIGLVVHEYYGMSETTGILTGNPLGRVKFGTVGTAVPGVEVKIAEDGEIIARGRTMTKGYLRMAEKTSELIDEEGWLHTGDLGAMDKDGYLTITGRKKDILITAGGKNVAPAEMEGHMNQIVGVGQVVVVGDRKPYLSALVALDPENLEPLAEAVGIAAGPLAELAAQDAVREHLMREVEAKCNARVARYQTIKRIHVVPHEFSVEGGELTPTMKVKRNVVATKYADDIEALYDQA